MSELWHGRLVHGPIEGCSDECGARYASPELRPVHSRRCPNRPPERVNEPSCDRCYITRAIPWPDFGPYRMVACPTCRPVEHAEDLARVARARERQKGERR